VRLWRRGADDVFHANPAHHKRIGYKRPVASPRHRLGAHQCARPLIGQPDGPLQPRHEFRRLHMIREAAKARVAPPQVHGVRPRAPQAAQLLHVDIPNPGGAERGGQRLAIELRIVARLRDRAYVNQLLNAVRSQQFDKLIERPRGMPDRKNHERFALLARLLASLIHLIRGRLRREQ